MICECKGHPFNCYGHPTDCGCTKEPAKPIDDISDAALEISLNTARQSSSIEADIVGKDDSFTMTHSQLDRLLDQVETVGWNAAIESAAEIAKPVSLYDMPVECRTDLEKQAHDVRQITMENIRRLKK